MQGYLCCLRMFPTYPESDISKRWGLASLLHSFNNWQYEHHVRGSHIMVCEGDAFIDGNLILDRTAGWDDGQALGGIRRETRISGLVVTGSLTIAGALVNRDPLGGAFLCVMGSLSALHAVCGGAEIHVRSDMTLREVTYTHGFEGVMEVGGALTAPVLVNESLSLSVQGDIRTQWQEDVFDPDDIAFLDIDNAQRPVHLELHAFFEPSFQRWLDVVDRLCEGESVFKPQLKHPAERTEDDWLSLIRMAPSSLGSVPEPLRTPALCLQAVRLSGQMLQHIPMSLRDATLCEAACQQDGKALAFVPLSLRSRQVCLTAALNGTASHWIPEALLDDELTFALVRHNGAAFSSLPVQWQNDLTAAAAMLNNEADSVPREFQTERAALTVIADSLAACERVPAHLFTQRVFQAARALHGRHADWKDMVNRHRPAALKDVVDTFKAVWACFLTEAVCLAALRAGVPLYQAPSSAITPAVSQAAFNHNPFNFMWIPDHHKTLSMCERAVQTGHGALLAKVPSQWMTIRLCALAVCANPDALQYVPAPFKTVDLDMMVINAAQQTNKAGR